jgi:hypothetical protein
VNLTEWTRAQGIHVTTAYRWYREGNLPVPAGPEGRPADPGIPRHGGVRSGEGRPVRAGVVS